MTQEEDPALRVDPVPDFFADEDEAEEVQTQKTGEGDDCVLNDFQLLSRFSVC